jgi:hypothetical protein
MRRWFFPAILAILVIGGIVTAAVVSDGDGWDRHHDDQITRIVGADGQETIVIHDNDRPFFFPFGLFFFPLVFLFFFALMRAFFWRGGRGGPWGNGYGSGGRGAPGWFDEWHHQAHAPGSPSTAPPTTGGTTGERSE